MMQWLMIGLGSLSILGGVVTFWLPLPIGVPLILLGLPLVMRYSPRARGWILAAARRSPRLQAYLRQLSRRR